jgi:hypothetical protein
LRPDDILRAAAAKVEAVRVVSSALNPLLWLTGIVAPLSLVLALWTIDVLLREVLMGLAILPVLVTIVAYFVLLIRDPDRLQSEEYRLRQRAMKMIYKRGDSSKILDAAREIPSLDKNAGAQDEGDIS